MLHEYALIIYNAFLSIMPDIFGNKDLKVNYKMTTLAIAQCDFALSVHESSRQRFGFRAKLRNNKQCEWHSPLGYTLRFILIAVARRAKCFIQSFGCINDSSSLRQAMQIFDKPKILDTNDKVSDLSCMLASLPIA